MPVWQGTPGNQVTYLWHSCHHHMPSSPSQSGRQSLGGQPGTAVQIPGEPAQHPGPSSPPWVNMGICRQEPSSVGMPTPGILLAPADCRVGETITAHTSLSSGLAASFAKSRTHL